MTRRATVVLADDTSDIRFLTRTMLEIDGGFEVVAEASNGLEAVERAARHQPDLVVLDLAMPEMDGLQALPLIRERSPSSQVVILSGFDRHAVAEEALVLGAARYVQKGTPLAELVAALREVSGLPAAPAHHPPPPASGQDFVAMVVHDLRSPLTSIRAAAEILARDEQLERSPTASTVVEVIRRQGDAMERLVEDLLTVARVDGGDLRLSSEVVELGELVRGVASVIDHDVEVRCPSVSAEVDRARVAQIVENLVVNAVRYGAPPIEVAVEDRGEVVALIVSDAGAGIPEHRQPELFQRFSALAVGGGGHGLGLYIVRELARAHGGDVVYEAGSPGSRFVVTLPAHRTGSSAAADG
ncbi:MAG: response regulator [Acidimicrobiia bacterium]